MVFLSLYHRQIALYATQVWFLPNTYITIVCLDWRTAENIDNVVLHCTEIARLPMYPYCLKWIPSQGIIS